MFKLYYCTIVIHLSTFVKNAKKCEIISPEPSKMNRFKKEAGGVCEKGIWQFIGAGFRIRMLLA